MIWLRNILNKKTTENIMVHGIECISHQNARYKSFRVEIHFSEYDAVMSPDFWPEGIGCRRYISKQKQ